MPFSLSLSLLSLFSLSSLSLLSPLSLSSFSLSPLDDWLLYDIDSTVTSHGRGLAFGRIFDKSGRLVCSTVQEGLIRLRPKTTGEAAATNTPSSNEQPPTTH